MHSGQLATLRDVVNFYAAGGGAPTAGTRDPVLAPLGLSEAQKDDLVAFLESLTLDPLPSELSTPETR
jgi:cytochrome c peroxidase